MTISIDQPKKGVKVAKQVEPSPGFTCFTPFGGRLGRKCRRGRKIISADYCAAAEKEVKGVAMQYCCFQARRQNTTFAGFTCLDL
jgi:hypothetical protein